jgi:hypothetical protein
MSRAALALLVVAVGPGVVTTAPRLKDREVDVFPTSVGSRWVYQCGDHEEVQVVTKVEVGAAGTRVHVAEVVAGGAERPAMVVLVNSKGLFLVEEVGQPYDPPWCILKLPAVPDEEWEATTRRPDVGPLSHAVTTGKPERLTVAAGEFKVIPLAETTKLGPGRGASSDYSYAPGIGWARIVVGGRTEKELKSFTSGTK